MKIAIAISIRRTILKLYSYHYIVRQNKDVNLRDTDVISINRTCRLPSVSGCRRHSKLAYIIKSSAIPFNPRETETKIL